MNAIQSKKSFRSVREADFESEVLQSSKPVLAVFWAPWSRRCRVVDSVLEDIAAERAESLTVLRVNVCKSLHLNLWYGIESIPTLLYFENGVLLGRMAGILSKEAILAELESCTRGNEAPTF